MFLILLVNKTDMADKRLNCRYLQQWRDDQKLQVHLAEQLQPKPRRLIRTLKERLVNDDKAERLLTSALALKPEVIDNARCQYRIGKFFLLTA